jgi:hypothetical protein
MYTEFFEISISIYIDYHTIYLNFVYVHPYIFSNCSYHFDIGLSMKVIRKYFYQILQIYYSQNIPAIDVNIFVNIEKLLIIIS